MSDSTRRVVLDQSPPMPTEATFLGGILRKGESIEGWVVESKIQVASGEAELYIAKKGGQTAVVKYYRQNVVPKEEILAKLAAFKHEDIIQLLAYGTYNGLFYEVMEFAAGGGLDSRDAASKSKYLPLDEGQVIQMVREVNNAYKACHAIGIIHRDIKPANIFLRNADGMDYVIGDFGISSLLDVEGELSKRLTRNASRTEGYAAPEIYSGVVGSEVDYYALGVTVWEVMTGLNAFEGRNPQFIIRDTMEGRIADDLITRAEAKGFSPRVQTLIRGLLTHRHDKRWGDQQVEDWLAGKEVEVFAAPVLAAIPPFTFEGKKLETAAALAVELLVQPEKAQKYLYRGLIEGWLAGFDQAMAMEVGDIKEGLGDSEAGKVRAVCRVALLLNPGQPFVTSDGASMDSIGAFKQVLESRPESLVDHLKNPDDALWDFLETWGAGKLASSMKESIAGEKSQKKIVNLITVALSGKVIRPFEGTRFAGTELSRIEQLEGLPSELRKRLLMELEDANGLLAVWLELASGREYPKSWKSEGVADWDATLVYWSGKAALAKDEEANPEYGIGDRGPAGGFVFFDKGNSADGWRYLEAAPTDQSKGIRWNNGGDICIPTKKTVGTGRENTESIILFQGKGNYAAMLCKDLIMNGFSDWFLPSIKELELMCDNLCKKGQGGFGGCWYWSSSQGGEFNTLRADAHDFCIDKDLSVFTLLFNDMSNSVRACRAFSSRNATPAEETATLIKSAEKQYNDSQAILNTLMAAAENGDAEAQYKLGKRYRTGDGVKTDNTLAFRWYTKSAEQEYALGENALANMYCEGEVVPRDFNRATELYIEAAKHGMTDALINLGNKYEDGLYIPENKKKAAFWYRKALDRGNKNAQEWLDDLDNDLRL